MIPRDKSSQAPAMEAEGERSNPYSPAVEIDEPAKHSGEVDSSFPHAHYPSPIRTVLRWSIVCSVAAVPSFFLGVDVTQGRLAGMIAGVLSFIAMYVALDYCTRYWPIRQNAAVRRTLVFVYVSRILVSIVFPVGLFIDMFTGMAMMSFAGNSAEVFRETETPVSMLVGFWVAYRLTIMQGILMNVVLTAWGLFAFPVFVLGLAKQRRLKQAST